MPCAVLPELVLKRRLRASSRTTEYPPPINRVQKRVARTGPVRIETCGLSFLFLREKEEEAPPTMSTTAKLTRLHADACFPRWYRSRTLNRSRRSRDRPRPSYFCRQRRTLSVGACLPRWSLRRPTARQTAYD